MEDNHNNHMEESEQKLEMEVAPVLIDVHPNQLSVTVSIGSDLRFSISKKRVTSLAISNDEMFVCFADMFGMVYVVDIRDYIYENPAPVNKKAVPILSHYCSIITRLVTVFPKEPVNGAHEIQSFCRGHTEFVSCIAFVSSQDYAQGLLVSGSGDSTVRLWDYASGSLLDTCDVGAKDEEIIPAVTDLCTTSDGSLVAVAIQRTLSIAKVVAVKGETFIPTSIGASFSVPLLWMVMGASSLHSNDSTLLARVRVISGFGANQSESVSHEVSVLEDTEIPGGEPLLQGLQGKLSIGVSTAAEAVKTAMRNLLIKKNYSAERREVRKKGRNDKKNQSPA
ncbi:hypothetical protein DH2020_024869 [Rehmannia glutinosa]|uniref:Uncharacterized protein n=1 Tax=Rehmannia glutinosa TaxID=99300 RepID=A0ABR0W3P9_REHGL